jgi:hypothetical protein
LDSILKLGFLNKATHNCMLDLAHELFLTKKTHLLVWVINSWAKSRANQPPLPLFFSPPFSILFDSWSIKPPSIMPSLYYLKECWKFQKIKSKNSKEEKKKVCEGKLGIFTLFFQHEIFKINYLINYSTHMCWRLLGLLFLFFFF